MTRERDLLKKGSGRRSRIDPIRGAHKIEKVIFDLGVQKKAEKERDS